jgi:beta-lactam-binding protein with PASTA domain
MLVMPDVVGESNVNSAILMNRAGFNPQNVLIEAVPAPLDQFGTVVRTSPKAGKKVSSDAIVRLYIGRGGP